MNFSCQWIKAENSPFSLLKIYNEQQLVLVVQAIDLTTWTEIQSPNLFSFSEIATFYRDQGTNFITLWEDVWLAKPLIVQSRIKALLGRASKLPARVTKVRRITKQEAHQFLLTNHLQDPITAKYRYGLFLPKNYFRLAPFLDTANREELLIAVATFSQVRIFQKNNREYRSFEMVRFANLLDTLVIGGLDKLLKAFEKERQPDDIMTYADLDWSEGKSYSKIGFEAISDTPPYHFALSLNELKRATLSDNSEWLTSKIDPQTILIKNSGSRKFVRLYHHNIP